MAGDWIKMRADLLTHPKVVRMSSALRADRLRISGGLFAVWCLFDTHSVDGRLEGYTLEALDDLIGFSGFGAGMQAVGWLEIDGDSLCTPRFEEHNGQSAKRRASETERKRNERKASAPDADKKRTREEKRREEPSSLRSEESAPRATRKCPESFEVAPAMREWAAAEAPGVDLIRETAKFRDHTFKTAHSDWPGAWRNWIRRSSETSGRTAPPSGETAYQRSMRERMQQIVPGVAARAPGPNNVIEMEVANVAPRRLDR